MKKMCKIAHCGMNDNEQICLEGCYPSSSCDNFKPIITVDNYTQLSDAEVIEIWQRHPFLFGNLKASDFDGVVPMYSKWDYKPNDDCDYHNRRFVVVRETVLIISNSTKNSIAKFRLYKIV